MNILECCKTVKENEKDIPELKYSDFQEIFVCEKAIAK